MKGGILVNKKFLKVVASVVLLTSISASAGAILEKQGVSAGSSVVEAAVIYKIDKVVVKKDNQLYSLTLKDYSTLKLAKAPWITGTKVDYIASTNGSSYKLTDFIIFKSAQKGNKAEDALALLNNDPSKIQNVTLNGTVAIGTNGSPVVTPIGETSEDFIVENIY